MYVVYCHYQVVQMIDVFLAVLCKAIPFKCITGHEVIKFNNIRIIANLHAIEITL